jgi:hypothetical protein
MSTALKIRLAFSGLLTVVMTAIVSGISTIRVLGPGDVVADPAAFFEAWTHAWFYSWIVAAPTVYFVAPWARGKVEGWFAPK